MQFLIFYIPTVRCGADRFFLESYGEVRCGAVRCGFVGGKIVRCGAIRLNRTEPHRTVNRTVKSLAKNASSYRGVYRVIPGYV